MYNKVIRINIILAFVLFSTFPNVYSQSKSVSSRDLLSIGGGIGEKMHFSSFISYTFVGDNVYQLSITGNQEFSILGVANPNYIVSSSFAYCEKRNWTFGFGTFSAGPSLVFGKRKDENIKYTVGVNVGSQFLFTPLDELGLGFDAFLNLNIYETFYGLRIAVFFKSIK
jgi:hypothetical protein